ncbi:hypothetical protein PFISCL1PPCAC_21808, partial [Pristionchus fissidentatus]
VSSDLRTDSQYLHTPSSLRQLCEGRRKLQKELRREEKETSMTVLPSSITMRDSPSKNLAVVDETTRSPSIHSRTSEFACYRPRSQAAKRW